jgi:hypothetical protein
MRRTQLFLQPAALKFSLQLFLLIRILKLLLFYWDWTAGVAKIGGASMVMHPGERWRCIQQSCGCTILVESGSSPDGTNPRCSCGSVMKKEFKSPVLSYLEFLHLDPPLVATKTQNEG